MEYKLLRRINPTDEDLTAASSIWLASRIMPGKGNTLVSFPHFRIINNAAARTGAFSSFNTAALLAMNDNAAIVNVESAARNIVWRGCWVEGNRTVIGRGHASLGLICPLNTFNVGYRYRRGWRANRVS